MMVTIIHLTPSSTQPVVYTIRTLLGRPSPLSFTLEFESGVTTFFKDKSG